MERTGKFDKAKGKTKESVGSTASSAADLGHPSTQGLRAPAPGGEVSAYIEETTGKLPWVSWVGLAALSVGASVIFAATPRARGFAACAGTLAPCFLMMGIYNKLARFERIEIQQHLKLMEPHVEVPSPTSYLS